MAEATDKPATPEEGAAAALRFALAHELGLSATAAISELSFIHGRLNLSAQLVRAMADREGYRVVRVDDTDEACTAVLVDKASGQEIGRTTYTIEDARRAGLIRDRSNWKTAPARMLWARASKRVVDDFAPAVSLGITTPEEEAEISGPRTWDDDPAGPGEVLDGEAVADVEDAEVVEAPDAGVERVPDPEPELVPDPPPWEEPPADPTDDFGADPPGEGLL